MGAHVTVMAVMAPRAESTGAGEVSRAVRRQYEAFPYPDYGLFLPLRWQEGYASTALFSAHLARMRGLSPSYDPRGASVLIAGCGDVFPAILDAWEPRSIALTAADLSESNLRRARVRTWTSRRKFFFLHGNLEGDWSPPRNAFDHVDCYGVLHHLENPRRGLRQLVDNLKEGGTLRLMVYNTPGRHWIHGLQDAFRILSLSPYERDDRRQVCEILNVLVRECPSLAERIAMVLPDVSKSPTRLVDTFLHAREVRWSISDWFRALQDEGLSLLGLFDRYGELDDLPNPLWQPPTPQQLEERGQDRRFENNLELYCIKGPLPDGVGAPPVPSAVPWGLLRRGPPHVWFSFEETRDTPWAQRWRLWRGFLASVFAIRSQDHEPLLDGFGLEARKRLARLGAIFPSAAGAQGSRGEALLEPLADAMEPPSVHATKALAEMPGLMAMLQRVADERRFSLEPKLGSLSEAFLAAQVLRMPSSP